VNDQKPQTQDNSRKEPWAHGPPPSTSTNHPNNVTNRNYQITTSKFATNDQLIYSIKNLFTHEFKKMNTN
jgi:hypothetical protein